MRLLFLQFLKNESAATAIEYALIAAGIALAIVTVLATNLVLKKYVFTPTEVLSGAKRPD